MRSSYFGPNGLVQSMEDEPRTCIFCNGDVWDDDDLLCEACKAEEELL